GQQLPAAREGDDQLLPKARHAVEERPELAVGDAEQPGGALGDGRHDLRPAGFDDVQVDVRLTGPKDDVAVGVAAGPGQGLDDRQLGAGEAGEGGLFRLSHCVIPDVARTGLAVSIIRPAAARGAIAAIVAPRAPGKRLMIGREPWRGKGSDTTRPPAGSLA